MTRSRVMVTGTGHLGVGEGIVQCLRLAPGDQYDIVAANSDMASASLFTSDHGVLLPPATAPGYLELLLETCTRLGVRFLIPGSEPELRVLAAHSHDFDRIGCALLANSIDVIAVGDDKMLTHEFLARHGIATPRSSREPSVAADGGLGWPVVVKPVSGGGSKNVFIAQTAHELEIVLELMRIRGVPVFVQEYVGTPDDEYTASALRTTDGVPLGSFAARRRLAGGATGTLEVEDFPEVRELAETISGLLEATGPMNIQARIHNGEVCVFEINPRFSGSAPFRALCGFNEPHLLIQYHLGRVVEPPPSQGGFFGVRSFDQLVIPLDAIPKEWRDPR